MLVFLSDVIVINWHKVKANRFVRSEPQIVQKLYKERKALKAKVKDLAETLFPQVPSIVGEFNELKAELKMNQTQKQKT